MSENELLVQCSDHTGLIRLNRPAALNSLTLGMVRDFAQALEDFAADPNILAVVVMGEGGRGFCAGGDLRALYRARGMERNPFKTFWREEFGLNARIARFPKPYIALMDGIVMGAGIGLSAHGNCRIVTERTRLAMPETRIGFIPDVGGSWLLTRKGGAGRYMALSGEPVGAGDAIRLGLADFLVVSERLPELLKAVMDIHRAEDIPAIIQGLASEPEEGLLTRQQDLLDAAMQGDSVEAILDALTAEGSDFALWAAQEIGQRSPTSLKLTHALLRHGADAADLETCLTAEYRVVCALLDTHDLYEGVRAAIIDKDRRPHWSPERLDQVDDRMVAELLAGTGEPDPEFTSWS